MEKIGKYHLIRKLGEGGMAEVFLVKDEYTERIFAMKILYPHLASQEFIRQRFIQEAKTTILLQHANIVKCLDINQASGRLYILMEYIEGIALSEIIGKHSGPIPHARAVPLFRQMLKAVGYAHQKGVVHRDLKPSNILVEGFSDVISGKEKVKIVDFGIAKLIGQGGHTATGTRIGTLQYMSPEQVAENDTIDQRSDIYSLGMTLYQMLSGQLPFGDTTSEYIIMDRIVKGEIENPKKFYPEIPDRLVEVIFKSLANRKEDRYQNCEAFLLDLPARSKSTVRNPKAGQRQRTPAGEESGSVALSATLSAVVREEVVADPELSEDKSSSHNKKNVIQKSVKNSLLYLAIAVAVLCCITIIGYGISQLNWRVTKRPIPASDLSDKQKTRMETKQPTRQPIMLVQDTLVSATADYKIRSDSAMETDGRKPRTSSGQQVMWKVKFHKIPGGEYYMGSEPESGAGDETPAHRVLLSEFYLSETEVTVSQFREFVEATSYITDAERVGHAYGYKGNWRRIAGLSWRNPGFPQSGTHPVVCVSWNDAMAYCQWKDVRLPTEAEWEFAARSGGELKYSWGDDLPAIEAGGNIRDESCARELDVKAVWPGYDDQYIYTAPVTSFQCNIFQLYNLSGNVSEWCSDYYDSQYYYTSAAHNPTGALSGDSRICRGGSWCDEGDYLRTRKRNFNNPDLASNDLGFRIAQTVK